MISVAIPCYRSEKTIGVVVKELVDLFVEHGDEYQIILVNDGSPDNTYEEIKKLSEQYDNIMGINFSKNYGQHSARMAAIPYIKGDYIVYMDDDGQHPVSEIYTMIDELEKGDYDIVYANFKKKKHNIIKRIGSSINTATLAGLTGKPKNVKNSSFSVMRGFIAREMKKYTSPFPSWSGFLMQITHNVGNVEMNHQERMEGTSNYTFKKMVKLYINSLTGFSIVPLRFSSLTGAISSAIGILMGIILIIRKILHPQILVGYTSIIAVILLIGGLILMMLGLLGEYIGRIYMINNNLPQYSIRETCGTDKICKESTR